MRGPCGVEEEERPSSSLMPVKRVDLPCMRLRSEQARRREWMPFRSRPRRRGLRGKSAAGAQPRARSGQRSVRFAKLATTRARDVTCARGHSVHANVQSLVLVGSIQLLKHVSAGELAAVNAVSRRPSAAPRDVARHITFPTLQGPHCWRSCGARAASGTTIAWAVEMRCASWALMALLASGCAPRYSYVPTTNATANMQGRVAADYPIPPSAPQGDVKVASYGITDVAPPKSPSEVLRALHMRVVLANNGVAPWTFDTREQRVALDAGESLAPAFASANAGMPPPIVSVEPNGKRVVDLFFLLPANLQHADAIPEFDALWRVSTGVGVVAERTPFERLVVEPEYGGYNDWDYGDDYYWGGPYWTNPEFGYDGVAPGYFVGGPLSIHRSPHFWHGGSRGGARGGIQGGGFHGGGAHGGEHR